MTVDQCTALSDVLLQMHATTFSPCFLVAKVMPMLIWAIPLSLLLTRPARMQAALVWLSMAVWSDTGLDAARSGYASSVLGLLGFAGLVSFGSAGMLVAASLWAWRKPSDPRGRGVALNSSLVSYASAATWFVVLLMVHLWPRIAG